jgi:hypothetical protein
VLKSILARRATPKAYAQVLDPAQTAINLERAGLTKAAFSAPC